MYMYITCNHILSLILCEPIHTHTHSLPQRSIEDEIERESQAEIVTVLISYLLMFVYIMFFLGHIRSIKTLLVRRSTACVTYLYARFKGTYLYVKK